MYYFRPDITDIPEIHIVRLARLCDIVNVFTVLTIENLLRGSDNEIMATDSEHGSHHEQFLVKIRPGICGMD